MERLTKRIGNFIAYSDFNDNNSDGCYEMMDNCLHKLAEYEDDEEQGLILRLPCKVGDTLYQPINTYINEYKVIGLCFDIFNNKFMYEVAYEIASKWYKTTCNFEAIGKTVFLTKEEAEKALKQMGERENE